MGLSSCRLVVFRLYWEFLWGGGILLMWDKRVVEKLEEVVVNFSVS